MNPLCVSYSCARSFPHFDPHCVCVILYCSFPSNSHCINEGSSSMILHYFIGACYLHTYRGLQFLLHPPHCMSWVLQSHYILLSFFPLCPLHSLHFSSNIAFFLSLCFCHPFNAFKLLIINN